MMIDDANPYVESNFSWAEWTPNTTLKLCRVPWDASYRDIVRFVSCETQQEWFDRLDGVECRPATMHIFNAPARVELPFNEASNWNYLVAYNDYPGLETPRAWYYYIQHVEYVNAHCTQLTLMLDVWQSFQFDVTFGSCYVTRGHIGVANEHQWNDYGRTYLALPEGLDTGSEMVTTSQEYRSIIEGRHYDIDGGGVDWVDYGLIVVSTTNLTDDPGNTSEPKLTTATGAIFEQETDGCSVYYCENRMAYVANIMALGTLFPWVTQGICAVYMVPKIPQDYVSRYGHRVTEIYGQAVSEEYGNIYSFNSSLDSDLRYEDVMTITNFRDKFNVPVRYRNLRKLYCYPYCVIECSCLNGTVITYRPEDIQSDTLTIRETYTYAPSGARINFYIPGYNEAGASTMVPLRINGKDMGLPIDGGEMLNASFGITNLPHFSVVNNGGALAMANSAYTRAYAQESAQWTRQKALTSANVANSNAALQREYATRQTNWANENRTATNAITANSLNQSLAIGQNQTSQMANLQVEQNIKSNNLNGMAGIVGGGLNAIASRSPLGAVNAVGGAFLGSAHTDIANYGINSSAAVSNSTAAASTANQLATNAAATSQANAYASGATGLSNQLSAITSQANYGLASYAAQGDYQNAIAGINAQVQQMQLTPPTTSGALGGDMFNLSNGIMGVLVRFKTCAPSALRAAGEYMLRYGYFVQRFLTPPASLECMEKFTFWQMQEAYVRGTLPEEYRLTIKGMFERGVTVWNKPEYIGVTDWADNEPLPGISYE
jgi:hypothetical protein|nr:MAG TPA: Major tail protein [Caudoviricetes sp.]